MTHQQAFDLAVAHHQAGHLAEAEAGYRAILAVEPHHAEALHLLGLIAHEAGQDDAAAELIRQSIALSPGNAEFRNNLGNALQHMGRLEEAIAAYRKAIALAPDFPEAHSNLGNLLREQGHVQESICACRQAVAFRPDFPEAHCNLGNALGDIGDIEGAIDAYRRAIALRPGYAEAHSNLGNALQDKGRLEEAIAACRQALSLRPDFAEASSNLGNALKSKGQLDEAVAAYRRAIALKPDFPKAHFNLALALLLQGDFAEGRKEYEWRWKVKGASFEPKRQDLTQPQWDGGPLDGRTILLHAEQGFGDAIQFIRYLPLVAQRGGRAVVECSKELKRLFQATDANLPVLIRGQPLPPFDVQCPLLSLPRMFLTDLTNIPNCVPYLHADAQASTVWRDRLAEHSASLKVGLVWAGNAANTNDRNRSFPLAALAPLARIFGVHYFSLQKGGAAAESKAAPPAMEWTDAGEDLEDFGDTAALIANLDLVITVDTAVAHLAGAMGRPVWVLLPFAPDWRWMLERSDSPWYPTMRLFRQPRPMAWEPVIEEVRGQLELAVQSRGAKP